MNTANQYLLFRKQVDKEYDEAIENGDITMIEEFNKCEIEAMRQGKSFYHMLHEMLVEYNG